MSLDLTGLRAACAEGPVARVLIVEADGSTPREAGTAMLVTAGGLDGTIGGGALEFEAIRLARRLLERGVARDLRAIPLGPGIGQCCGGRVTLLTEVFTIDTLPEEGPPFLRGPGEETPAAIRRAAERGAAFGFADGWVLEATVPALTPVWLYGAGHVGRAIADCLDGLAFDLTWVDDATDRFPDPLPAGALVAADPVAAARHAPAGAHHLVLTYSHALDLALCDAILSQPHAGLGLIGSATKRARFDARLRAMGHDDERIARMVCPIGDPSLGKEPKAIALGVVAALQRARVAEEADLAAVSFPDRSNSRRGRAAGGRGSALLSP